ncbi:MAG: OBAP family protein [Methylococcaceae bacterium]|nr:OBAP family protein [Methylococcaceae bacterium]
MNKTKLLLASALLALTTGCATAEVEKAVSISTAPKSYNETLNPRQKEYPNHLGFNDLHIQAIRHLKPNTNDVHDPDLQTIVHHHCKAYDDGTFTCLMFHTGMKDQDKPIGFEYIITTEQYNNLPADEKKYWHYHLVEVPRAHATFPDLTPAEAAKILPAVNETYGKVIYFMNPHDKMPLGEPYILIVQDMPEQD